MPAKTQTFDRKKRVVHRASLEETRQNRTTPEAISLSRTAQNLPTFPPELYTNIIEWITDRQDLCNLSLTSRICSAEAQRALYSIIDLAQNTRAPVLWADTILRHPQKALTVQALTLRFDLSFIIVPDLLLSSLQSIAQALRALRRLHKLVLVGHPLAMMHPIHTWILDGCTAELRIFHNSVFPSWAVVPFLSRHPQIGEWKQNGTFPRGVITDTMLPHLTIIDAHLSILASFTTSRSLTKVRLKIDDWGRETSRELVALSLFGTTLATLTVEDSSTINHLKLAELLFHLAKATPNLKTLAYTKTSSLSAQVSHYQISVDPRLIYSQNILFPGSIENLSKLEALETLILQLRCHKPCSYNHHIEAIAKHAFDRCPSLHCVALKYDENISSCRRQGGLVVEGDVGALFSDILESDLPPPRENVCCPSRILEYPFTSHNRHM
ncbi:hypothetical protein C0995_000351 [Termitomyces sp. Mi166|nr:hypothetical protein C0995_000351 [Termitomyces sp. Mi166\